MEQEKRKNKIIKDTIINKKTASLRNIKLNIKLLNIKLALLIKNLIKTIIFQFSLNSLPSHFSFLS
jgi:hypothetical protein